MSDDSLKIVCTDRGQHAEAQLFEIRRDASGELRSVGTYTKRAPWARDANVDGAAVADHVVMPVDDPRDDFGEKQRFRRPCDRCGRDKILLPRQLNECFDARVLKIDVSLLS